MGKYRSAVTVCCISFLAMRYYYVRRNDFACPLSVTHRGLIDYLDGMQSVRCPTRDALHDHCGS